MRVVHYQRSQPSDFHTRAGSYASCFFIPDEQIVLFAEQHSSFGGISYPISDREDMLQEAQVISDGQEPDVDGVRYSNIKVFEYDDSQLRSLIENAKRGKDLEEKVRAGINDLMKKVKDEEESVKSINPTSLDSATRDRLEQLVETYVQNDRFKSAFYDRLGNSKAEEVRKDQVEQRLRTSLRDFQKGKVSFGSGMIGSYMGGAQQAGLEDVARGFATIAYKADGRGSVSYGERIQAAEILGKDVLPIKKERLLDVMNSNWSEDTDYLKIVRQSSEGVPEEDVTEVAEEAYKTMMKSRGGGSQRSSKYLRAAQLAKVYLGENEFHDAGKKLVEANSKEVYVNQYERSRKALAELSLPDEMVRPLMLRIFEATLDYKPEQAAEIRQRYGLTEDEVRSLVDKVHREAIISGKFGIVLPLRERYGSLIRDQGVPTDDVRTLVGVMNYQPEASQ